MFIRQLAGLRRSQTVMPYLCSLTLGSVAPPLETSETDAAIEDVCHTTMMFATTFITESHFMLVQDRFLTESARLKSGVSG